MTYKLTYVLFFLACLGHAFETPFTPYRDGTASVIDGATGRAKYLEVKAGEKKAWVDHILEKHLNQSGRIFMVFLLFCFLPIY